MNFNRISYIFLRIFNLVLIALVFGVFIYGGSWYLTVLTILMCLLLHECVLRILPSNKTTAEKIISGVGLVPRKDRLQLSKDIGGENLDSQLVHDNLLRILSTIWSSIPSARSICEFVHDDAYVRADRFLDEYDIPQERLDDVRGILVGLAACHFVASLLTCPEVTTHIRIAILSPKKRLDPPIEFKWNMHLAWKYALESLNDLWQNTIDDMGFVSLKETPIIE